jgi:hypothetical protein
MGSLITVKLESWNEVIILQKGKSEESPEPQKL